MNNDNTNVETPIEVFICDFCEDEYNKNVLCTLLDAIDSNKEYKICNACYDDKKQKCYECDEIYNIDSMIYYYDDRYLCGYCREEHYYRTDCCDEIYRNDQNCECDCDEERGEIDYREYYTGDDFVDNNERIYSCEIECNYNDSIEDANNTINKLPECIGIASDGSLNDRGIEIITPKLSGEIGRKVLEDTCRLLNEDNFDVDKRCGLHVHIDSKDYLDSDFKTQKLMLFYLIFEDVIMSFLPLSRRENRYCLPLSNYYHPEEIINCSNIEELEKIWYRESDSMRIERRKDEKYDNTRYAGINFHSLLANGHIEIRYHSGTINFDKIYNWIKLHVRILDEISVTNNSEMSLQNLLKIKFHLDLKQKTNKFFELLKLDKELIKYFKERQKKFANLSNEENE